jgi:GntR family transcriptional regulator, vanillate catabolism transcriptional regulator
MALAQPVQDSASVVATLRKLIIEGRYAPGARLAEVTVADELGVSRTPVRLAFRTLEREGLLQMGEKRGFLVRAFSDADVECAVEVRGVLEGLAARRLAERGMTCAVEATLNACLQEARDVLHKGFLVPDDIGRWSRLNEEFHSTIVGSTQSAVIRDAIARNDHLPFASADSIVIDLNELKKEYEKLRLAHFQHELVFEAISNRESARAEMLMREHAYIGLRYGRLFGLASQTIQKT